MCWLVERRKLPSTLHKQRKVGHFSVLASNEDGVAINGGSQLNINTDGKNKSVRLNKSLQGEDQSDGLLQSLHEASRVYELSIKGHRSLIGDELTEKERKTLKRTLTDVASVVPIGFLMLLPVTAVGHAAMLAAIQRYAPALIPSTYGPERLDLLRQLEKMKEMEANEANPQKNSDN